MPKLIYNTSGSIRGGEVADESRRLWSIEVPDGTFDARRRPTKLLRRSGEKIAVGRGALGTIAGLPSLKARRADVARFSNLRRCLCQESNARSIYSQMEMAF